MLSFEERFRVEFPRPGEGSRRLPRICCALVAVFGLSASACAPRPVAGIAVAPVVSALRATAAAVVATETTVPVSAEASVTTLGPPAPKPTPARRIDPRRWIGRPLLRAPWPTDKVAITFDDGPSKHSAEVLAILAHYGIRATFFYVGDRCPRYRDLVRQAFDAGFEIGDHTLDHHEIFRESASFDLREIDLGAAEIERETGVRPTYVRPPAGHWDATTLRCITQRRMVMALWSVHGQDTGTGTHAATIAARALRNVRGGDILLLHETNPETVKALPAIIGGLLREGFKPVTLSELLIR